MSRLPLLLGEAPSRTGDRYHMFPLSGAVARTLCTLAGIPPVEGGTRYGQWTWALYDRFECDNLFERYADATPWSAPQARLRWEGLRDEAISGEGLWPAVVCLGRRVQAAVTPITAGLPFHEWRYAPTTSFVTIPHPSGLNRLLNEWAERERCGVTLRTALAAR